MAGRCTIGHFPVGHNDSFMHINTRELLILAILIIIVGRIIVNTCWCPIIARTLCNMLNACSKKMMYTSFHVFSLSLLPPPPSQVRLQQLVSSLIQRKIIDGPVNLPELPGTVNDPPNGITKIIRLPCKLLMG